MSCNWPCGILFHFFALWAGHDNRNVWFILHSLVELNFRLLSKFPIGSHHHAVHMYESRWFYSIINSGLDTLSFSSPLLMTWQLTGICEGASCSESSRLPKWFTLKLIQSLVRRQSREMRRKTSYREWVSQFGVCNWNNRQCVHRTLGVKLWPLTHEIYIYWLYCSVRFDRDDVKRLFLEHKHPCLILQNARSPFNIALEMWSNRHYCMIIYS